MRIYTDFKECLNELKRELAEMGISVKTKTYQDKDISNNPDFETLELQNYIYTVTNPREIDLSPTQPWADLEFNERITNHPPNPGEAYLHRLEVWEQFLEEGRTFAYTYGERIKREGHIDTLISNIENDPAARQHFLAVWDRDDLFDAGGKHRIPCSLGYLFQVRKGKLNITYLQRSADFNVHLVNDLYLSHKLQNYVADNLGLQVGIYVHWLGSLHIFKKDVKGVF